MGKIEMIEAWKYKDKIYEDYHEAKAAFDKDVANRPYFLYDQTGAPTSYFSDAYFIYLPNIEATKRLFEDLGDDEECLGITEEDAGLFFWDEWDTEFRYFDEDLRSGMCEVLKQILKE